MNPEHIFFAIDATAANYSHFVEYFEYVLFNG